MSLHLALVAPPGRLACPLLGDRRGGRACVNGSCSRLCGRPGCGCATHRAPCAPAREEGEAGRIVRVRAPAREGRWFVRPGFRDAHRACVRVRARSFHQRTRACPRPAKGLRRQVRAGLRTEKPRASRVCERAGEGVSSCVRTRMRLRARAGWPVRAHAPARGDSGTVRATHARGSEPCRRSSDRSCEPPLRSQT